MMARTMIAASSLALLFATSVALAQSPPPPLRVRGTVDSLNGQTLAVKSRDGTTVDIKLADNTPVRSVVKASLSDVKQGGFVGITAMPQPDGTQKAVEIHIFPEAMRGTGEGHRPWDLMPNSTMTNANIDSEVTSTDGKQLVLKYKDGEKKFTVPANVEVVEFAPAAVSDLKSGQKIFIAAAKKLDNDTVEAKGVVVGRNGVNPPM